MKEVLENRSTLLTEIMSYYALPLEEHRDRLMKLWEESREANALQQQGIIAYFLGEVYFRLNCAVESVRFLDEALRLLMDFEESESLCKVYNLLGLLFHMNGTYLGSAECFSKGLQLAKSNQLFDMEGVLYNNLANLYHEIGDAAQSIACRERAHEIFSEHPVSNRDWKLTGCCCSILAHYIRMGEKDKAAHYYELLHTYLKEAPALAGEIPVLAAKMQYAWFGGERALAEQYMEQALQKFGDYVSWVEYLDEVFIIGDVLMEYKEYDRILRILDRIEEKTPTEEFAEKMLRFLEYRIQIYEKLSCERELAETTLRYFRYSQLYQNYIRKSYRMAIEMQHALREEKLENSALKSLANTDSLTGLANRRSLNERSDEWFDRAKEKQHRLCVEMLDLDFFKECNDTYGHQKGDECLVTMAGILKEISSYSEKRLPPQQWQEP